MDEYGDAHRYFAQALLSRPVLTQPELAELFRESCERAGLEAPADQLKVFVRAVNEQLRTLGLELAKGRSERDGHIDHALICTAEDDEPTGSAAYPEPQLRFMQAVVREIATSVRGDISSTAALHLRDGLPKRLSLAEAEAMLQQLVDDRWLERTKDGRVALDTRAIMELKPYLTRHFGGYVTKCPHCNHVAVRGACCQQCDDPAKHHYPCLEELRRKKVAVKCRGCSARIGD